MLDNRVVKEEIDKMCKKNGLAYRNFENILVVNSGVNDWKIVYRDEWATNQFEVRHKNKSGNQTSKEHYHHQAYADSLIEAMSIIVRHDYKRKLEFVAQ